jgi:hypothetical protein
MNDNADDRLKQLFARAREAGQEVSLREEGFEGRLMARLREKRLEITPWYLWAWRSVPLFSALVVVLCTLCSVQTSGAGSPLFQALTSGYEESTLVSYYAGE